MIKTGSNYPQNTSFRGDVVVASVNELIKVLGCPTEGTDDIDEKVQNQWLVETEDGTCGYVYDWKEYRRYSNSARIDWHIGAKNPAESHKIKEALQAALTK